MINGLMLLVLLMIFCYGLFLIVWPEKARKQFLSQYDLDAATEWSKPHTWMKFKPSSVVFRITGIIICLSLLLLYFWRDSL